MNPLVNVFGIHPGKTGKSHQEPGNTAENAVNNFVVASPRQMRKGKGEVDQSNTPELRHGPVKDARGGPGQSIGHRQGQDAK